MITGSSGAAALIAGLVATAVVVLLSRRRRKRRSGGAHGPKTKRASVVRDFLDVGLIIGGVALALGTLLTGLQLLRVADVPGMASRPGAIGVVPPVTGKTNRGFAVALAIRVDSCSKPVHVTLAVGGTAEYWQDRADQVPRKARILLAIRRANLDHVAMYEGSNPEDVTGPLDSLIGVSLTRLDAARPTKSFDATVLSATAPDWGQMQYAVVTTFNAHWLRPRSLGTCYLALPALAGSDTLFPAEEALGHASWDPNHSFRNGYTATDNATTLTVPLVTPLQTLVGNTTVAVDHGEVQTNLSLPPPNALFDGNPKWTCESPAQQVQQLSKTGPLPPLAAASDTAVPVFSLAGIQQQGRGDCSGTVVVAEDGAESHRDLVLLLMGSLISLGAAVAVEVMLDWREFGVPFRRLRASPNDPGGSSEQQHEGEPVASLPTHGTA